ncbi:hypothetical protein KU523_14605 (plasmid) [Staphylococcus aureus]|uniref:hypothetical protein n=1 Tax=Staphylococcus aureus TaxID=1280 RepID=UPI001CEC38F9|nr:hypothetical protein [Staphylococcus aureus]UCJ65479.1 hypothetical protein KU523_14425 [Staphylococcus aureus]UCJ65492.1 hypothetical protein KU523_14520 [Staphylococcus aureus]UCJ65502.1 hypothetical protein KU523_14605 [Staphylococcus aureus]
MYNINSSKIIKGSLAFVIASGVVFSPVGIDNDSEAAEANSSMVSKKVLGQFQKLMITWLELI